MLPLLALVSALHVSAPPQQVTPDAGDLSQWPISTKKDPCGAQIPLVNQVPQPPELRPHDHRLDVTLFVRGQQKISFQQVMCYVFLANTPKGTEALAVAPTLHVKQGDKIYVTLVNELVAPVHHTTREGFPSNVGGGGLDIVTGSGGPPDDDHTMGGGQNSAHGMQMDTRHKGDNPNFHRLACGQNVIEVVPTPDPDGRIYGLHRTPFEETNLHFHGLNTSPKSPGDDVIDTLVCPKLEKNDPASSFTYVVDIPRDEPPGLYWYHPHPHGESEHQLLAGLTGAIIVDPLQTSPPELLKNTLLIIRDAIPAGGGTIRPRNPRNGPKLAEVRRLIAQQGGIGPEIPPPPKDYRFGPPIQCPTPGPPPTPLPSDSKILSINDKPVPEDPGIIHYFPTTSIHQGETQYYRIVNTGADTMINLGLRVNGQPQPLMVVARDSVPLVNDASGHPTWQPVPMRRVLLTPGARVEFYLTGPHSGSSVRLFAEAFDTGCFGDATLRRELLRIHVLGPKKQQQVVSNPPHQVDPVRTRFSDLPYQMAVKHRIFAMTEYNRDNLPDPDFYITELNDPRSVETPYEMTNPPEVVVKRGTVEDWTFLNYTQEVHAFHIHQIHFLVESHNGIEHGENQVLDSLIVPYGHFKAPGETSGKDFVPGRIDMRMDFRGDIIGEFVFHCHILEHEDNGMMANILVTP